MNEIGTILQTNFREGCSLKEVSRDLDVSRSTVRKVVRSGASSFSYERKTPPRPNIKPRQSELGGISVENAFDTGVPTRLLLSTASTEAMLSARSGKAAA